MYAPSLASLMTPCICFRKNSPSINTHKPFSRCSTETEVVGNDLIERRKCTPVVLLQRLSSYCWRVGLLLMAISILRSAPRYRTALSPRGLSKSVRTPFKQTFIRIDRFTFHMPSVGRKSLRYARLGIISWLSGRLQISQE